MSGKSTFLRTIGINARLALAGAPVCAESLSMVNADLATSIQVVDMPEQGWSRFYAEVRRISDVLGAVDRAETEVGPSSVEVFLRVPDYADAVAE